MPRKQSFGKWLTDRRTERGLGRQEVADRVGVTYAAVRSWELDTSLPRDGNLSALCKALRASVRQARAFAA